MDLIQVFTLAFESVKTNKLRSILTALGVIIGVASIILLVSIANGLQSYVQGQFEKLGANSVFVVPGKFTISGAGGARSVNKLTLKLADQIEREKGEIISDVLPILEINVTASWGNKSKITTLLGTKSTYFTTSGVNVQAGRLYNEQDNVAGRKVAVVGRTLARDLYGTEEAVGRTILVSKKPFTVVGVLSPQGNVAGIDIDNQVIIPVISARKLTGSDSINEILVRAASSQTIKQTQDKVTKILKRSLSDDDFSILTQEQLLSSVLSILGVLTFALGGIAAISLIVGGVGISNIMLVSVTERTREIGLRKAVGATQRDILSQFLVEAVILSLSGGLIGVVLGFLGSLVISKFLSASVPLWAVALGIGFSSVVGVVFGVIPALRASRLEPIESLRHE